MRKPALSVLAALSFAACQDAPTAPIAPQANSVSASFRSADQTYIVIFHDSVRNLASLTSALVSAHHGTLQRSYVSAIHGFAATLPDSEIASLERHPGVVHVERDAPMHIVDAQPNPPSWGLDRIDQASLPLNSSYNYATTGSGVNVYILDTGILTTHVDFGGRASGVYTAIVDGNGTTDCNGHGTHVSGTVAGTQYGIAKQAKLYAVRVLDCSGSGSTSTVIAGIDWITANAIKPAVANMSLGGGVSPSLDQAVANSVASGITYAIAAGNSNQDACLSSPGRTPEALTVGASDISDTRASFSNFGSCVDLFAPGVSISSDWIGSNSATANLSGTSMATPHVAGVAALFLQTQPNATPAQVAAALTANATAGRIADAGAGSPNLLLYMGFIGGADNPPVPSFTWSCPGVTCTFDASGSTDDGSIVSYAWDYGKSPGGTGSGKLVTVTYPHGGGRTVTLTVTDNSGQTASITKAVTVGAPVDNPPVASFTVACSGLICNLDGSGSTDDGSIASYAWALPGSTTPGATGAAASATYLTGGTKTFTLTVTDNSGQTNSITKSATVTAPVDNPPVASFTVTCSGLTCNLNGTGSTDDGSIASYAWSLPGSTTSVATGPAVSVTYTTGGTKSFTLTVTDNSGQTNSITKSATVTAPVDNPPVASFTWSCPGVTCTFDASGSTDDGSIVTYAWDFNKAPGGSGTGKVVAVTYPHAGTRNVTLTVTDNSGQATSITKVVTVGTVIDNPPVASFTISCSGLTCSLDGSGSTDDGSISSYAWSLPGSTTPTGSGAATSATYTTGGTKNVTLTVTDNAGQTNSITKSATVTAPIDNPPVASFTWSCQSLTCTFDASASTDDGSIVAYDWDFNKSPNPTGSGKVVSAAYPHVGTRNVKLTVTDNSGQQSSVTIQITVQ